MNANTITDYGRAAQLRRWEAERLVADADRRAAAFATRPCEWCGHAIAGERRDVAGAPMHAACEREYAQDMGYLTDDFAPLTPSGMLASDLRPAPVLAPPPGSAGARVNRAATRRASSSLDKNSTFGHSTGTRLTPVSGVPQCRR